jgi:DNA-binding transcriptional ArsR family regulator
MLQLISIASALSDASRVRALMALRGGELCLCQIIELLGLAPATVSKHMTLLRDAGLVETRKQGRWMYFRLAGAEPVTAEAGAALDWVCGCLERDEQLQEDGRRLKTILREKPEALCKRQLQRRGCCSSAPATPAEARWPRASRGRLKAR